MYHVPFRKVIVYQHAYLLSALICISCDALTIAHQLDPRSTIPAPIVIPASNNWYNFSAACLQNQTDKEQGR